MAGTMTFAETRQQPSESEARILGVVLRSNGATQPEIARATGLSQQTVSRLVNDLLASGALVQGG